MKDERKTGATEMLKWIDQNQRRSGVSDEVLAHALGYENPKVVELIKSGAMSLPVNKAVLLARAIGVDPGDMLLRLLEDISPDLRAAVEDCVGVLSMSAGEKRLLNALRRACPGKEPVPIMFEPGSIMTLVVAQQ